MIIFLLRTLDGNQVSFMNEDDRDIGFYGINDEYEIHVLQFVV